MKTEYTPKDIFSYGKTVMLTFVMYIVCALQFPDHLTAIAALKLATLIPFLVLLIFFGKSICFLFDEECQNEEINFLWMAVLLTLSVVVCAAMLLSIMYAAIGQFAWTVYLLVRMQPKLMSIEEFWNGRYESSVSQSKSRPRGRL